MNPICGGSHYTTRKNADRLVLREAAVYVEDSAIMLTSEQEVSARRTQWAALLAREADRRADEQTLIDRGGVIWWNGCDHRPNACHRPGENVLLPRPDRAGPYFAALERV